MKVPISWLREYVDFDVNPEELADKLTFSGIELEGIEVIGSDYAGMVVGEVIAIAPHPGADRLRLCRVNDGAQEVDVVCGAFNFEIGDKVPFAPVGTVLPNGMKIKRAKIRGEESLGMLCAEDELGLSDDHSGIMLLPRNTAVGAPLSEVLGPPETVLTLEVTWNRSDCLSMIGIAREVAALCGSRLRLPSVDYPESGESVADYATVDITDAEGCPRYTGRVLSNIRMEASPLWMQRRLSLCGVRPISNVVDITNYVLLECGQPLHAFDHALLSDGQIVVRRASEGETMATLDGTERRLTPETVVIADARRAVAVAGVMGGAGTEIREDTGSVLLESAAFDPARIHATSLQLGLSTESSHRFERGVDIANVDWASRRATALMVELAGATAAKGVLDAYPAPADVLQVSCRFARVRGRIGVEISDDAIVGVLQSLELPVARRDGECCVIDIPSFRPDLRIEADLIEEVARMHGMQDVPENTPVAALVPGASDLDTRVQSRLREVLIGLGLTEAVHYSFLSQKLLDMVGADDASTRVVLPHPVSADYAVMRPSLVPQMVETLGRNLAHQVDEVKFFEMGRVFLRGEQGAIGEEERLCIGLMGPVGRASLDRRRPVSREEMFLWAKGIVESLCAALHVPDVRLAPEKKSHFESGWAASILSAGTGIGELGLIASRIGHAWRMQEAVAVVELLVQPIATNALARAPLSRLPTYPAVARDIALVVGAGVHHADVERVIRAAACEELTAVNLFDIYRGKRIGEAKRSLAYSLVYRSMERTLTDDEVNGYHDTIKTALREELKADIREE
jgi:phenylalanyl-tRNA synthetase beta chain